MNESDSRFRYLAPQLSLTYRHIALLPRLFGRIIIPEQVHQELLDVRGKSLVSEWAKYLPEWLEVITVALPPHDAELFELDLGERAAIVLAGEMGANLLIDERRGRAVAQARGLSVTGTIGILGLAASKGWIDFLEFVDRLRKTNFRASEQIVQMFTKQKLQNETSTSQPDFEHNKPE